MTKTAKTKGDTPTLDDLTRLQGEVAEVLTDLRAEMAADFHPAGANGAALVESFETRTMWEQALRRRIEAAGQAERWLADRLAELQREAAATAAAEQQKALATGRAKALDGVSKATDPLARARALAALAAAERAARKGATNHD